MDKKMMIILVVVVLVLGGGYLMMKGSSTDSSNVETPGEALMDNEGTVPSDTGTVSAENSVEIKNFAFNPKIMTVKVGTTVTFTNKDIAGHSATSDDGTSFDTGVLRQGETGTVTFDTPGTFGYHCTPHPDLKGTIVVEE